MCVLGRRRLSVLNRHFKLQPVSRVKTITLLSVAAALLPATVNAQNRDFPQRPIRIVVPVPPGGSVDATARLLAPKMSESLGQSFVIDNRGGASTNIGMEMVARAPADGYTLLALSLIHI
mgnify:CR=1 FL=1